MRLCASVTKQDCLRMQDFVQVCVCARAVPTRDTKRPHSGVGKEGQWEETVLGTATPAVTEPLDCRQGFLNAVLSEQALQGSSPPPQTAMGWGQVAPRGDGRARVNHTQERGLGDRGGARAAIPRR